MISFDALVSPSTRFFGIVLFWVIFGLGENRLWNCNNNRGVIFNHFSLYHVVLGFFSVILAGVGAFSWASFGFLLVWSFFGLDVVWWISRYVHLKIYGVEKACKMYNGERNAWHERGDWDNFLGLPVVGCYVWWWLSVFVLVVLGVLIYAGF
jgi:hypothetical protein